MQKKFSKFSVFVVLCLVSVMVLTGYMAIGQSIVKAQSDSGRGFDFSCNAITGIDKTECETLVALYDSTNGDLWINSQSHTNQWKGTLTPCTWYGVTCDGGHVTQLIMESNNLTGTLPATIGNLSYVTFFDLADNYITGSIPDSFGSMANLTVLAFTYNRLAGSIPATLGGLTKLQSLLLGYNSISGPIPPQLGSLTDLKRLGLDGNALSGTIPSELWNLTKLVELSLNNNQLVGSLSSGIGSLVNLQQLYLHSNYLKGPLPHAMVSLVNLDTFWFNSTALCAPRDAAFQTWLSTITTKYVTWNCLAAPVKTSPVNNTFTNDTTPKFTWVKQMNGEKYQITVDNNSDFSSPVLNANGLVNPYKTFTTALAQGIYYWRVRAVDPGGNWSPWSTKWKFTVDTTKPGIPTLVSPTNGSNITDRTPTFTWLSVDGAAKYQLMIDDNSNFSSPVFNFATLSTTTKTLGTALAPKLYYWRVRARDAAGNWGAWSAAWTVKIK